MPECKRITPEEAVAAYAKTGFEPIRGEYFGDSCKAGCGIGAYTVAFLGYRPCGVDAANVSAAMSKAGFSNDYRRGFACGFDGDRLPESWVKDTDTPTGYADGKAAWDAVRIARKEASRA